MLLRQVVEVLQAATAAIIGKDAGRPSSFWRCLKHLLQLSQPMTTSLVGEANLRSLAGQGTSNKEHPIGEARYSLPVMG
jgi:hypothetical protein